MHFGGAKTARHRHSNESATSIEPNLDPQVRCCSTLKPLSSKWKLRTKRISSSGAYRRFPKDFFQEGGLKTYNNLASLPVPSKETPKFLSKDAFCGALATRPYEQDNCFQEKHRKPKTAFDVSLQEKRQTNFQIQSFNFTLGLNRDQFIISEAVRFKQEIGAKLVSIKQTSKLAPTEEKQNNLPPKIVQRKKTINLDDRPFRIRKNIHI